MMKEEEEEEEDVPSAIRVKREGGRVVAVSSALRPSNTAFSGSTMWCWRREERERDDPEEDPTTGMGAADEGGGSSTLGSSTDMICRKKQSGTFSLGLIATHFQSLRKGFIDYHRVYAALKFCAAKRKMVKYY